MNQDSLDLVDEFDERITEEEDLLLGLRSLLAGRRFGFGFGIGFSSSAATHSGSSPRKPGRPNQSEKPLPKFASLFTQEGIGEPTSRMQTAELK